MSGITRTLLGGVVEQGPPQITVGDTLENAEAFDYSGSAGGQVYVPDGSSLTTLTFYVASMRTDTFYAAYTTANVAVTMTVAAGRAYPLPDALFAAGAVKILGNALGTVYLTRKS